MSGFRVLSITSGGWTNATRPTPLPGTFPFGFNSDLGNYEFWDGLVWREVGGGGGLGGDYWAYVMPSHPAAADDGDLATPFVTIQAAIDVWGAPTDAAEYQMDLHIFVEPGTYTENLLVPHRGLTIHGEGVVINGNITRQVSVEEEFGVSSNVWRGGFTLDGGDGIDGQDNHQVSRLGVRLTGNYECQITPGGTGNTTHDTCFRGAHIVGTVKSWDGTYGGPSTGTEVLYLDGVRIDGEVEGRNFYCQRWSRVQFGGGPWDPPFPAILVNYAILLRDVYFWGGGGSVFTVQGGFDGGAGDEGGWADVWFQNGTVFTCPNVPLNLDSRTNWMLKNNVVLGGAGPTKIIQADTTP